MQKLARLTHWSPTDASLRLANGRFEKAALKRNASPSKPKAKSRNSPRFISRPGACPLSAA
jgi:hypothetical protein